MAERRMFHTIVVESDAFLDLPHQAQLLYFHLGMHADDDGFINGPKQIARKTHIAVTKLQQLIDTGFVLDLEGVVVLRHWRVANTLRKARLKPLQYPEIAKKLYIQNNGIYALSSGEGSISLWEERSSIGRPLDDQWMPKVREGKRREGKVKKEKIREDKVTEDKITENNIYDAAVAASNTAAATIDNPVFIKGELGKGVVLLSQEQITDLVEKMDIDCFDYYVKKLANFILEKNASVKNHYATILKWWEEDSRV